MECQVIESKILRLNMAGQPIEWLAWREAVCLFSREMVVWTLGDVVKRVRGGYSRIDNIQSQVDLPSIIACDGSQLAKPRSNYPLNNPALFARDGSLCMYCSKQFISSQLTRDHIIPTSRGGEDKWENVVSACRRCNQHKANFLLEEINMDLVALPYRPNNAEYLALTNSKRILGDQMEFLRSQFSKNSRWL
tara:strand:- start:296 stop:871 length:576 start_codon:yes stop_codon:yes gene_type:complete